MNNSHFKFEKKKNTMQKSGQKIKEESEEYVF